LSQEKIGKSLTGEVLVQEKGFTDLSEPFWCIGSLRAKPPCLVLMGVRRAAGLRADLFLEAEGGTFGWFYVVMFPEVPKLEPRRLDCVSSLVLSSVKVYKGKINELTGY
jgi:hypothetical protein